jgi:nitrite reductase/ring-hydroxylating ferredoxin subunit
LALSLPVSLERMYENALDWEHLPWVHASSFASIDLIEEGAWGWRAHAVLADTGALVTIELCLDRSMRRWITRTLDGPGSGAEVWTNVAPMADNELHLVIDFFAPASSPEHAAQVLNYYSDLYQRLYDEDLALMVDRQAGLDHRRSPAQVHEPYAVGEIASVRNALPLAVEAFGSRWRIVDDNTGLVAHAERCPHRLGSLMDAQVTAGEITCPWHGYRFDLATGQCLTGDRCTLPTAPVVDETNGQVILLPPER